jgi:cytochrome d ubiquinol oxidase subunit I
MDALLLARLQFAITTVYHFFFVPLTLGLAILVAIMQTVYYRTGDEQWKKQTQFWGKLFLINFAMGVVTGIVQEFQFGMNWSEYSRFVGDIFGAPLAIEALLAFFLESTFIGVWFFGWDKVSKRVHLAAIWLVAFSSNLSALWILLANSFMQQPVGYVLRNGRAEMNDFLALVTNPNIFTQYPHVLFGGIVTAGFFVLGISAWHLLRNSNPVFFTRAFKLASVYALIGAVMVGVVGHAQAQDTVQTQPMKMAAAEALYETADPASLSLLTIGDLSQRREVFAIRVPNLLSLLAYNQFTGEVKGINDLQAEYQQKYGPGDYVPPVALVYWSFRAMVGAGLAMVAAAAFALFLAMQNQVTRSKLFLQILPWMIVLPYLGNSTGWLLTELGRAPWIVFGLMRLENGVSPASAVNAVTVLITLVLFTLLYGALMVVTVYLMRRFATHDPDEQPAAMGAY